MDRYSKDKDLPTTPEAELVITIYPRTERCSVSDQVRIPIEAGVPLWEQLDDYFGDEGLSWRELKARSLPVALEQ